MFPSQRHFTAFRNAWVSSLIAGKEIEKNKKRRKWSWNIVEEKEEKEEKEEMEEKKKKKKKKKKRIVVKRNGRREKWN